MLDFKSCGVNYYQKNCILSKGDFPDGIDVSCYTYPIPIINSIYYGVQKLHFEGVMKIKILSLKFYTMHGPVERYTFFGSKTMFLKQPKMEVCIFCEFSL